MPRGDNSSAFTPLSKEVHYLSRINYLQSHGHYRAHAFKGQRGYYRKMQEVVGEGPEIPGNGYEMGAYAP